MIITAIEKETGIVAYDAKDLPDIKDPAEFSKHCFANPSKFIPVNYDVRIKFLQDNDYEVNRKNLTDGTLSTKPPTSEK